MDAWNRGFDAEKLDREEVRGVLLDGQSVLL
jgi:hypothetical protein